MHFFRSRNIITIVFSSYFGRASFFIFVYTWLCLFMYSSISANTLLSISYVSHCVFVYMYICMYTNTYMYWYERIYSAMLALHGFCFLTIPRPSWVRGGNLHKTRTKLVPGRTNAWRFFLETGSSRMLDIWIQRRDLKKE